MLKAEASRIALTLNSEAIFSSEEPTPRAPSPSSHNSEYKLNQGFEDTIELYERAIQSARQHGFMQYEALGNSLPKALLFNSLIPLFSFSNRTGIIWEVLANNKDSSPSYRPSISHRRHSSIRAVGRNREGAAP